ncbi:hypothetical protein EVAR_68033_1 [Eumeta japonica]|uniref:DUF5641 domain-containing protein n=1 Tax=Eumeta variegata TaxID=151549 RepID=A0A4C1SGI1_EUMVA|nr:hypothetical protein EVAR_68033_1 [Eumeta japonica]
MGGAWERLVRSVKTALAATLREEPSRRSSPHPAARSRAHCQLQTVDGAGHFDDNVLLGPANWRTCQRLADHFWQRWLREYLPTLVLARGDHMPRAGRGRHRADRRLIITSIPRGPEAELRRPTRVLTTRFVVDVETTGGVLRRPTSKIVVLVSAEATAVPCPEVVLRTEGRMLRTAAQLM